MKRFIKRLSSGSPRAAIILILIGIIGAAGAVLFFKRTEPKVDAQVVPRAARLERMDGNVDIAQALYQQDNDQLNWTDAAQNASLTVGDRIFARDNSHAEIAFTGRNYARLNPDTALDVLSLADKRTQLALRNGSAIFDVGDLTSGDLFEVATPCGAVDFTQPGLYQLGIGDDGNPVVSVLNGLAQVVGPAGSGEVSKGEVMTLACQTAQADAQTATPAVVSPIAPDAAGNIVDDYYRYRYPNKYDGRYHNYDAYVASPNYYDQYHNSASYDYLAEDIPGLYDLDEYGDWQDVNGYGRCWAPRVEADWSPYREGYWDTDEVWGPTWVASEPWGYAPYHYGRWAYVNQQRWVWVPEDCRTNPVYAPALVAFVPIEQSQIAWVPLGPGERYVSRYYDASFGPRYLASPQIVQEYVNVQRNYVNLNYTSAVTVVPVQAFTRRIDRGVIVPTNPRWIQQAHPVVDPYAIDGVRQVARQQERAQRKDARREMQAAMFNRPVVTSVAPVGLPGQANAAQALQYQSVTDKQKRNKLQIEKSGQVAVAQRPDGVPLAGQQAAQQAQAQQRDQRIAELKSRLQQGDRSAKQELRQLKRERREQPAVVPPQQQAGAQQQQAQQATTQKQQRRLERQQQQAQQQQAAQQATTQKQQRRLERQQQAAQQQAQVNQQREQRRAQKQAAQQQTAQQQQAQRHARKQPPQQMVQQQQQQRAVQQQQQQMRRQQKQQARQQQAAQQQGQINQQRAQMKAQRQQQAQQQQAAQQAQHQAARQQRQQQMVQQQQQQRAVQQQQQQMRQQQKQQMRQQQQAVPRPPANPGQPAGKPNKKHPQ